jgi:hypothetical protein
MIDNIRHRLRKYADVVIGLREVTIDNLSIVSTELNDKLLEFGKHDAELFVADYKYNILSKNLGSSCAITLLRKEYSDDIIRLIARTP